ncbi:MAG: hypothetical protein U1E02_09230 [Hydrogenophaga sp.]|nr:hypothetical protein [Hydrogenophaga sp.]
MLRVSVFFIGLSSGLLSLGMQSAGGDGDVCSSSQPCFLKRLLRDNRGQVNVRLIDFSDLVYAKRVLQYKFYTRDVQDLLLNFDCSGKPAARLILSILVPLYQGEYAQEKKDDELFEDYLVRSHQERACELEYLVRHALLFEKLDALYVPLCDAIIADHAATVQTEDRAQRT